MCTGRMLVWTAAAALFFLFGVPATADDRAFDIPIQQGQGVSGNVKLRVSKSVAGELVVTVDEASITYEPQAGFNGLDETNGNLEIQGLLLVPQFGEGGTGAETRVLVPFANLQKRGATYSCVACGAGVLPIETLAGSDRVIPGMVVSGLIMFMPQENLAAGVEEPQTESSDDVTTESSAQRLERIARAANLPIASLPNLKDLQSEDYSILESLLDGIKDETGLDAIAKSILASAAAQAANMAYSPVLKKLVFDRFGLQAQTILKGFKANPMEYYGAASNKIGADLLKGVAIGIAGSMVADAVFSLKPLSDLPPNWKEPMRAMTKATVVETINFGTSAVDPSVAAAGIANRLYEFYQIYKASVALADTQNEAIVAAAIGLETAARLVTLNPSEKNSEIARSTIASTVANLNQAFGDGYSIAMTEIVNLTFVGLLSEFRGDSDRAAQMVVHIREKGKLGADDALPDVLARPINWIASFATWSGDPPSRVAALMISSTVLNNLGQGGQTAPDIVDQAQPPVAAEAGPQPDTPNSEGIWGPDIVPKSEIGYPPCSDQKSNDACLKALGLTDAAIAFSAGMSNDYSGFAFATSFQELGAVDLAVALYQGASSWYMPVLLNGQPDFVVAGTTQDLFAAFRDAESRRLLGQFPNASIFETEFYNPVSSHRTLSDGTQRFTRIELVTEGCRACAPIGTAITFLDIGPATGGKILRRPIGIGYDPALPGMDLQVTPQVLVEIPAIAQLYLNKLGYDAGSMDGRPGSQTRQAVSEFQSEHCLQPTGLIDLPTTTALLGASGFTVPCKPAASTSPNVSMLSDSVDLINIFEFLDAGSCGDEPCGFSGRDHDYNAYVIFDNTDFTLAKQFARMSMERGGSGATAEAPQQVSAARPIPDNVRREISTRMLSYVVERADCGMDRCGWAVVAASSRGAADGSGSADGYFIDMAPVGSIATEVASAISSPIADGTYINMSAFGGVPGLCAESDIPDHVALRVTERTLNFYEYSCQFVGSRLSPSDDSMILSLRCGGEDGDSEVEKSFRQVSDATFAFGEDMYQRCLPEGWVRVEEAPAQADPAEDREATASDDSTDVVPSTSEGPSSNDVAKALMGNSIVRQHILRLTVNVSDCVPQEQINRPGFRGPFWACSFSVAEAVFKNSAPEGWNEFGMLTGSAETRFVQFVRQGKMQWTQRFGQAKNGSWGVQFIFR